MASLIYRLIKWKPYSLTRNYDHEHFCHTCPKCGHRAFKDQILDTVSNHVSEVDTSCLHCGHIVNFWAYGSYDPCYSFSDRSLPAAWERFNYFIRGLTTP